jgi:uncharacterized protein YdaU (DUF1376 family)
VTRSPSFQFYPSDWMTGAPATMSPDETHVYVWLLCKDWTQNGFIVDSTLSKWCRMTPRKFRKAWERVRHSFVERDGRMYNPRLDKERAKQEEWRRKSAEGGRLSGALRGQGSLKGGSRVVEPKANSSVFSFQSSDSGSSSASARETGGRSMLLDAISEPTRRDAMAHALDEYSQGYGLGAGLGVPTSSQLDEAARDVAASVPPAAITPKVFRKFLIRTMRGEVETTPTAQTGRAKSFTELVASRGKPA